MPNIWQMREERKLAQLREVEIDIQIDDTKAMKEVNDIIRQGMLEDERFNEELRPISQLEEKIKKLTSLRKIADEPMLRDDEKAEINNAIEAIRNNLIPTHTK